MCIAVIGAVVALAGSAVSAAASFQQAKTAEAIGERNAQLEQMRGAYEAKQISRKLRYVQGAAATSAAANGIGLDGSYLDVIADNEIQGQIDAENAIRGAKNRSDSLRLEGQSEASRLRAGGVASIIGGASSFLKTTAELYARAA